MNDVGAVGKNVRPYATHALAQPNGEGLEHTLYTKVEKNPSAVPHSSPQNWSTETKAFHVWRTAIFENGERDPSQIVSQWYAGHDALRF